MVIMSKNVFQTKVVALAGLIFCYNYFYTTFFIQIISLLSLLYKKMQAYSAMSAHMCLCRNLVN
jgi:hypothetical protein